MNPFLQEREDRQAYQTKVLDRYLGNLKELDDEKNAAKLAFEKCLKGQK